MKLKFIYKCFLSVIAVFLLSLTFTNSSNAIELSPKVDKYPLIAFANLEHSPFIQGEQNAIYLCSKNYLGEVQYQVHYMYETSKDQIWNMVNNKSFNDGWTSSVQADEPTIIDISDLKLNQGKYKFLIRVKRVLDSKNTQLKKGEYDDEYIAYIDVVDKNLLNLIEDTKLDKIDFNTDNILNISKGNHIPYDVTYKLNLYSLSSNQLLNVETEYSEVDYSKTKTYKLDSLVQGKYIAVLFSKYTATYNSSKVYEGWMLKAIDVKKPNEPTVMDLNSVINKKSKVDVAKNDSYIIYIVEQKDTLFGIIRKFNNGVSKNSNVQQLMELNNLKNADDIKLGQTLFIPKTWK